MQPQIATMLAIAEGESTVIEAVWDNRFRYIDELYKMGAQIKVEGKRAIITGKEALIPSFVNATDLRAGAAMVIAGLMTEGKTTVGNIAYIDRGYEKLVEKLTALGADIKRVSD